LGWAAGSSRRGGCGAPSVRNGTADRAAQRVPARLSAVVPPVWFCGALLVNTPHKQAGSALGQASLGMNYRNTVSAAFPRRQAQVHIVARTMQCHCGFFFFPSVYFIDGTTAPGVLAGKVSNAWSLDQCCSVQWA